MTDHPDCMPAPSAGRHKDVDYLFQRLRAGEHCSFVGISNMGKSTLFRLAQARGLREWPEAVFIYVDCNRMLSMTDQGFYELVLRCVRDAVHDLPALAGADERLAASYQRVTLASGGFQVSLAFNEAITEYGPMAGREHSSVNRAGSRW